MLDKPHMCEYNFVVVHGLVAQLGAHHIRIVGVGSSNLLKSTKIRATSQGGSYYCYGIYAEEIGKIKCNADERCPLWLDAAEQ